VAGLAGAEVDVERLHAGVAADDGGVALEGERLVAPVLFADVGDLRAVAGVEIVGADGEAGGVVAARAEIVDDGHAGVFTGDDERVREDCGGGAEA
jgi:hypothetical protein